MTIILYQISVILSRSFSHHFEKFIRSILAIEEQSLSLTIIIILFFIGKSTPILYLLTYNRVKFFTRRPGQPSGRHEHMFYEEEKEKRLNVSVCTPLHQVSLLVLISIKYIHIESFLLNHSINHL